MICIIIVISICISMHIIYLFVIFWKIKAHFILLLRQTVYLEHGTAAPGDILHADIGDARQGAAQSRAELLLFADAVAREGTVAYTSVRSRVRAAAFACCAKLTNG